MKKITALLAELLVIVLTWQANAQWVQTGEPSGSVTRVLTAMGGALYAGTDDGVFLSVNNGNTWEASNAGLAKDTVVSFAVSNGTLFAGTLHSGAFASAGSAGSWTAANQGLPKDPLDTNYYVQITDLAAAGGDLYAGTFHAGVFTLRNGGLSWTPASTGLGDPDVYSLAVSGNDLFAGTGPGGGVFVSSDKGAIWTAVNNGLLYMPGMVYSVNRLAASNGSLFAGTFSGGVYRTENNGEIWTGANNGLSANSVLSLHAHGADLFAGTGSNGVFLSTDNGASWTEMGSGLPANEAVLCLCVSSNSLFAGVYRNGVWRSPLPGTPAVPTGVAFGKFSQGAAFGISSNTTVLRYTLAAASRVKVAYYDLEGRLVASQVDREQETGTFFLALPSLPEGFYVRDFRAGSFSQKDKIRIVR
jgi:ligand-binding sensor domain-containing protein